MAVIDDVSQHLHNNSIASLGTSLFTSFLPESPNFAIAVLDTGGLTSSRYVPLKDVTFQVLVRHTAYQTGKAKLDTIRSLLHGVVERRLINNGEYYLFIFSMSEGGHIGLDGNGRNEFSINFQCRIR